MDMNYRGECGREGVGRMEWSGGEWDNCNSIINKYIKNKKINIKKSFYAAGNHQKMKTQPIKWEQIFGNHISDKGLISKIYKDHTSQ